MNSNGAAPSGPLRPTIRRLRARLASQRQQLAAGWAAVEHARVPTLPLADLLPAGENGSMLALAEAMDENELRAAAADAQRAHEARMEVIERERAAQAAQSARLAERLAAHNADAARDVRALSSTIRTLSHPTRAATQGGPAQPQPLQQQELEDLLTAKSAAATEMAKRADEREEELEKARERAARAQRAAQAAAARRLTLAQGQALHRWDDATRTLVPSELTVVADGRCLQVGICMHMHMRVRVPPRGGARGATLSPDLSSLIPHPSALSPQPSALTPYLSSLIPHPSSLSPHLDHRE